MLDRMPFENWQQPGQQPVSTLLGGSTVAFACGPSCGSSSKRFSNLCMRLGLLQCLQIAGNGAPQSWFLLTPLPHTGLS